jgi:sugar lactone lactonase YvrE
LTAALVLILITACRPGVTPGSPGTSETASDPSERFVEAWTLSRKGDVDGSLRILRELDDAGWAIPPYEADFPALASRDEWKQILRRIAAREPRTARADVALTIGQKGLVAEGIAADPRDGSLFVGSIRQRKIVRLDPSGATRDFVTAGSSGLGRVLGIKVDVNRELLWAVANSGAADAPGGPGARSELYSFDLASGTPRASVVLEEAGHLLNDIALAPDGSVFVTDSEAGLVHRLDTGGSSLAAVPAASFRAPNGIAFLDQTLLVCDERGLWALDDASGPPRRLVAPNGFPLGGIDGLSARGRTLVAVQNALGATRILRIELAEGAAAVVGANVLETANPLWHIPTTGALFGDDFFYIGNSHVDAGDGDASDPAGEAPTRIHRLHVPG